jgi:hypothetical protein
VTPYRDENESLRAENERLKAELEARVRGSRRVPRVAVVLGAGAIGATLALQPWLNGTDARFWSAISIIVFLVFAAIFAAVRQT